MKERNYVDKFESKEIPNAQSQDAGILVRIMGYDPATHRVTLVRADTNTPLREDQWIDEAPDQGQLFEHRVAKTLKTSPIKDGPIVEVTDDVAAIRGSSQYGMFSYKDYGNIVKGPTSFAAQPHEIRLSGITTLNPLLTSGFPSTIVTPMPTCIFSIPGAGVVGQMGKDVAIMAGLVAALGVG